MPQIEPFRAISISALAQRLTDAGQSIIRMEFGQPSTGAPQAAVEAARAAMDRGGPTMGYWESEALKRSIAARYQSLYGVSVRPGQIVLTAGASPALVAALSCGFEAGDVIAFARPGYVAYRNTVRALHLTPLELDCGPETGFQLTAQVLGALDPAPAGVILASPANPTGTVIPMAELAAIATVARARGIRIISDEIYHGLTYGERAASALEFDPEALVINSFSKYFSMPGWRLGWLVAPASQLDQARAVMGNLFLTPSAISQHAGLAAMDCIAQMEGHIETYRANRAILVEALPRLGLTHIAPPDGAFYIYANIAHLTDDSMAFCERMLRETGVAAAPGIDFDPLDGHHHVRFSFAVSTPEVREAVARLEPWLAGLASAAA
jgi:aspartate/methionine/tyrosine aminotransferase